MSKSADTTEQWEEDHFRHNTHSHTEAANTIQIIRDHPSFQQVPDDLKEFIGNLHEGHKEAAMANKQAVLRHTRAMNGTNPDNVKSKAHTATNEVAKLVYQKSSNGFIKADLPKRDSLIFSSPAND